MEKKRYPKSFYVRRGGKNLWGGVHGETNDQIIGEQNAFYHNL